jgi:hypothetical protein
VTPSCCRLRRGRFGGESVRRPPAVVNQRGSMMVTQRGEQRGGGGVKF